MKTPYIPFISSDVDYNVNANQEYFSIKLQIEDKQWEIIEYYDGTITLQQVKEMLQKLVKILDQDWGYNIVK